MTREGVSRIYTATWRPTVKERWRPQGASNSIATRLTSEAQKHQSWAQETARTPSPFAITFSLPGRIFPKISLKTLSPSQVQSKCHFSMISFLSFRIRSISLPFEFHRLIRDLPSNFYGAPRCLFQTISQTSDPLRYMPSGYCNHLLTILGYFPSFPGNLKT